MKAQPQDAFPLDPPLDFLQHLWHLNHLMERMSQQMKRALGVTAQQRLLIRCIGLYPGITASQLAAVLHLDRGTISVGLTRLADKGLVTRRRDSEDSRRVWLTLTAQGRALAKPNPGTMEHAVARMLSRVDPGDVARVKGLLEELTQDLAAKVEGA